MAGHSQFANIKHRKGAQDKKRAKLFTKLTREIIAAAKTGLPDPSCNSKLRTAMAAARAQNLPKDRIEAAIKRGSSSGEGDNYEEIRYEGYAPGGIAVIVEALTDNRNRTASDVRSTFTKHGGNLGETGSVSFMFVKKGVLEYDLSVAGEEEMLEAAIEAGAENCEVIDEKHIITCNFEDLNEVRESITHKYGDPSLSKFDWVPNITVPINDKEAAEKLFKFIDALEDKDDVQEVWTSAEILVDMGE